MSDQLLSSKIVVREEEPEVHQIQGRPTGVLGIAGVTERGPLTSTRVTSPEEYRKYFGGSHASGYVYEAAMGFFENGGHEAWVQRIVHYTDPTNPATKASAAGTLNLSTDAVAASSGFVLGTTVAPFDLVAGDTLLIDIDEAGAPTTVTLDATAAARENTPAETYHIDDHQTLTVKVDRGALQTIEFRTTEFVNHEAATAEEVAAVINAKIAGARATVTSAGTKVTITSDKEGKGSYIEVTGGTANAVLTFNTAEVQGTSAANILSIDAVSVAELKAVIEANVAGVTVTDVGGRVKIARSLTGTTRKVQVTAASTADDEIGVDNAIHAGTNSATLPTLRIDAKSDGVYSGDLTTAIAAATSGEAARFNMKVMKGTVTLETWPNLSMDDSDARYVETIINDASNGSWYITATDLDAAVAAPGDRPVNGTFGPLAGGNDGLAALADADFVGASSANGKTGLRGFDTVHELSLLAVPGRATSAVQNAMLAYCEVTRGGSVFAVLDPPQSSSAEAIITYVVTTAALLNLSEFGAMYWPWIEVVNPNKTVYGDSATIMRPPSGHIAGAMVRNDNASDGGIYQAAAGTENGVLFGCLGFESKDCLDEEKRDLVYPKRINPITTMPGQPRFIDGCRTLKEGGNFPSVPERRGVIFIEQSVKDGLQWARHKNNDSVLRGRVDRTVRVFLEGQMNAGAFRSRDPATAFFIDFGDGLNPPAVAFAGKLIGRVGLATQKPAEFIILRFSQDTRAFTESTSQ